MGLVISGIGRISVSILRLLGKIDFSKYEIIINMVSNFIVNFKTTSFGGGYG